MGLWRHGARAWGFAAITAFALACTHGAVEPASTPREATAAHGKIRPFLWRAEKDGERLFLFGTIHAGIRVREELPAIVWDSLKASPCFVMETDLDQAEALRAELAAYVTLPPGDGLDKHVSPAAWQALKAKFADRYGEEELRHLRPWVLASEFMQVQFDGGELMDQILKEQALRAHDAIHYLESLKEQLAIVSDVVTFADLENLVLHEGDLSRLSQDMLKAYRAGDADKLRALVEDEQAGLSNSHAQLEKLLYARNRRWVPLLERYARESCFVAVGSGHLLGKEGLLSLLEARGFRIKRL